VAIDLGEAYAPGPSAPAPSAPERPAAPKTPCRHVSPWPDRLCRTAKPTPQRVHRRQERLARVIATGVGTTSPHDPTTISGVFAGNFDWHSAVHGHWALLSIARVTRNATLERQTVARLTETALRRERARLAAHPTFEMPYGRAWLLLLLDELERRPRRPAVVAALRRDTEQALLGWLRRTPYPEGNNQPGSCGFQATHGSWLCAYLLFVLSRPRSAATKRQLRVLRRAKLEPQRSRLAQVVHGPGDFLYLPALQAVVDRVDPAGPRPVPAYPLTPSPSLACPPLDATNAHSSGAAVVHLWPYALQTRAGLDRACGRYHTRLAELFSRPDHWAENFPHVSHWVPQFIWMALWLEAGRP
jgi:hypothetical protein